jgi:ferredoxin-nitrite reductase
MQSKEKVNRIERIKAERDGLDVGSDIPRYAQSGWEAIPADDVERLKWWGIFLRRQSEGEPGYFMLRIRIPGGRATAQQVRAIGRLCLELGRGIADITTRQQVQTRWLRIEDVPEALERLRRVGLVTLQTGMDNVRNVVGCPLAGLLADEVLDATPAIERFTAAFVANREFTNLPRKFNVTVTGCRHNCTHAETQDLALVPARKDGLAGFNVLAGGKVGSGGYRIASPLDAFVAPQDAPELCVAVLRLFRDYGFRQSRSEARLAFLLDDWGVERFRQALEERLGRRLERAGADQRLPGHADHLGVQRQRQEGLLAVGLLVPVGRIRGEQLLELARLSEAYGRGEVRFTTGQNAVIPHVALERLRELLAEPLLRELRPDPAPLLRGLVSCTGTDYCNLALIDTKRRALELARRLADSVDRQVSVHWSGCPAGCGNHPVADIGLLGKRIRLGERVVEAVDVFVGGSSGPEANLPVKLLEDVPCDELEPVLEALARYGRFDELRARLRAAADAQPTAEGPEEAPVHPEEVPEGRGKAFRWKGHCVAVFKREGQLYALADRCPHAGASLAGGVLDGDEVVCPEHGYRFHLGTGVCSTDESLRARTYRLVPDGGGLVPEPAEDTAQQPTRAGQGDFPSRRWPGVPTTGPSGRGRLTTRDIS